MLSTIIVPLWLMQCYLQQWWFSSLLPITCLLKAGDPNQHRYSGLAMVGAECQPQKTGGQITDLIQY